MSYDPPNPNGQAIKDDSAPVVIASDQTVPVSLSTIPLASTASTSAKQDTGNNSLSSIDGKIPTKGTATITGSTPVNIASDQVVPIQGQRSNAGSDTAAGKFHLTVGGSDGTNLRPMKMDTNGNVLINGTRSDGDALAGSTFLSIGGSDGTNLRNIKTDTAGTLEVSSLLHSTGSVTSSADIISVDCNLYRYVSVQILGTAGSWTITFQCSNDNTNWVSCALMNTANVSSVAVISAAQTTINNIYSGIVPARYFRARATTYASGTASVDAYFSKYSTMPSTIGGNVGITGVVSTGSASATNGYATYHNKAVTADGNLTSVKASQGVIGYLRVTNTSATLFYFKLYTKTSAPVLASDTPVLKFPVRATSDFVLGEGAVPGLRMTTGIAYSITQGWADNDVTFPAANDGYVNMVYT